MLIDRTQFTVTVQRLSDETVPSDKHVWISIGTAQIAIQPLSPEDIALGVGGTFAREYKGYAKISSIIQESDKLVIPSGNKANIPAGDYFVRELQNYSFSSVSHKKFYLNKPDQQ